MKATLPVADADGSPTIAALTIRGTRPDQRPFWHVERARIGDTRTVPVEVVVNGRVAATRDAFNARRDCDRGPPAPASEAPGS